MKFRARLGTAVVFVLLFVASSFGQEIRTDYDHHANFENYHTFSWGRVKTKNPLWQDRVKRAVDDALRERGWQ